MRISRETQIQSVSSFACPASPRPLPCLFTLEYVPKMQPLRARPNAPAATIFQQCAQRTATKTAATQRRMPKRTRSDHLPTMRPTRRHENRRRAAPHAQTRTRADRRFPAMRPTRRRAAPHARAHPRRPPHSSNAPNAPSRKPPPRSAARANAPRADRCLPTMRPTRRHKNRRRAAPHAQTRTRANRRFPTTAQRATTKTAAAHPCADCRFPTMRPTCRHENRRRAAPHARTHLRRPPFSSNAPNAPSRKPPPRSAARPNAHPRRPPHSSNAPNAPP